MAFNARRDPAVLDTNITRPLVATSDTLSYIFPRAKRVPYDTRNDPAVLDTDITPPLDTTSDKVGYHVDMHLVCLSLTT